MFVGRDNNVTLSQREREILLSITMREKERNTTERYVLHRERDNYNIRERHIITTKRERVREYHC